MVTKQGSESYEQWFDKNSDRVSDEWTEHIGEMQDSLEHKRYLLSSDKCFIEFSYEVFEREQGEIK
jgi:hypothetical protein